jgi:hypothetical protein
MKGLRTHVWPVIALAGAGVVLVGLLVLSGSAQAVACVAGAVVVLFAGIRALDTDSYRKRDRDIPSPPGSGAPFRSQVLRLRRLPRAGGTCATDEPYRGAPSRS